MYIINMYIYYNSYTLYSTCKKKLVSAWDANFVPQTLKNYKI